MAHTVFCVRYKKEMEGPGGASLRLGVRPEEIENVSQVAWDEWVDRQKMLLNEYRLQPWTPQAQKFLVEQMEQFFFSDGFGMPRSLFRRRSDPPTLSLVHRAQARRPTSCKLMTSPAAGSQ